MINQITTKVQHHYKCQEFTDTLKRKGIVQLHKEQHNNNFQSLAEYIEQLYRDYIYSIR